MEVKMMSALEFISAYNKGIDPKTIVVSLVREKSEIIVWHDSKNECFETWYIGDDAEKFGVLPVKHISDKSLYERIVTAYSLGYPMIIESKTNTTLAPALFAAIGELFYSRGMIVFDNERYDPDMNVYNTFYSLLKKEVDKRFRVDSGKSSEKTLKERLYEKAQSLHDSVTYGSMFMEKEMIDKKRNRALYLLKKASMIKDDDEVISEYIEELKNEVADEIRLGTC